MRPTTLGVWAGTDELSAAEAAAFAKRMEAWGYGALWIPEAVGREVFSACAWLLANTRRLIIASGIANIYARDPFSAAAAQKGLNEQSGGGFCSGLASRIFLWWKACGITVTASRWPPCGRTCRRCARRRIGPSRPRRRRRPLLAALGPKMLELAGAQADGAHPYNVPPEHTVKARALLGPGKLLCVEQGAILETDAARARALARRFLGLYLGLPNYVDNWRRLGFTDADFAAGADQVCVQAIGSEGRLDERLLALLAPSNGGRSS